MYRLAFAAGAAVLWTLCTLPASAESPPPRWNGPFGGEFHASFTVATDYAQSGISNTQNHPAFQKLDALGKALYELFHVTILPTLLRNYDRYSMASGVEIRMPFLDWICVC